MTEATRKANKKSAEVGVRYKDTLLIDNLSSSSPPSPLVGVDNYLLTIVDTANHGQTNNTDSRNNGKFHNDNLVNLDKNSKPIIDIDAAVRNRSSKARPNS